MTASRSAPGTVWWWVHGALVLGFTDFALGQLLDRGSAHTLLLYKVRPLEPIKLSSSRKGLPSGMSLTSAPPPPRTHTWPQG